MNSGFDQWFPEIGGFDLMTSGITATTTYTEADSYLLSLHPFRDQQDAEKRCPANDRDMSYVTFIVVFWFVAVTEQSLQNSTITSLCRTGMAYVTCTLSACRDTPGPLLPTLHNDTKFDQIVLQLFRDGKMINSSKSVSNVTFKVAFKNLEKERKIGFECLWKRNHTNVCRQEVVVDPQSLPAPVEELLISVRSDVSKMIEVKFSRPHREHNKMLETANVTAKYMVMANPRCSAKKSDILRADTRPCRRIGDGFVCANLFKGFVHFPAKVVATAIVENQVGSCSSSPFCKVPTYFEIYGGLKDLAGEFKILHSTPRLLVSWKIPSGLKVGSGNGLSFDIEYCSGQCSYQTENRSYSELADDVVEAKVDKNVQYKSKYRVRVRYCISDFGINRISPWTSPINITVPSQIPKQLPEIRSCKEVNNDLITVWKNEDVNYFVLRIEESGKTDSYVQISSKDCVSGYCIFSMHRGSLDKAFGITVLPCSEYGCNNKSDSSCYFRGTHSIGKSSNPKPASQLQTDEVLLTVVPLAAVLAISLASFLVVKVYQWRKSARSLSKTPIITPRHNSDSDSSYLHADNDVEKYPGYDPL